MSKEMAKSEKLAYEPLSFNIVCFEDDVRTGDIINFSEIGTTLDFEGIEGGWF